MEVKDFLTKQLALTPKQAMQFDSLRTMHRKSIDNLNESDHQLKDSLFANLSKPATDSIVINDIIKKIGNTSAMIDAATFYHFKKLRSLLNASQQKKFDSIIMQVLHMMARQGPPPNRNDPGRIDGNNPPIHGNGQGKMHHHWPPPDGPDRMHQGPPPGEGPDGMPPPGPPPGKEPNDRRHGPPPGNNEQ
jgi:hypothetical protein